MPITFEVTNEPPKQFKFLNTNNHHSDQDDHNNLFIKILPRVDSTSSNNTTTKYDTNPIQSSYHPVASNADSQTTTTVSIGNNSFVMSGVKAYSSHHHWIIRPDDVWLAITTQFSNYVNNEKRCEKLRSKLVDFKGKKELVVYGEGNLFSANYTELSMEMSHQIASNIKDKSVREWILPNFTTTTETDRMVGSCVLMSTFKKFFDYKFTLECNLPSVTLLGQVQDWVSIRKKADRLLKFDLKKEGYLKKWSEFLFPILDKFVESIKGKPDREWWNRVAHLSGGGSGPTYLSGWITSFCVFTEKGEWQGNTQIWNEEEKPKKKEKKIVWPIIDDQDIPRGYVTVPILVDDNGVLHRTEMFAGHLFCDVLEEGKSVRPRLDWALFKILN